MLVIVGRRFIHVPTWKSLWDRQGISWLAEWLSACQQNLCNIELVVKSVPVTGEISGSHGDEYEDDCLLGCWLTFHRYLLPLSSGRIAPLKRPSISTRLQGAASQKTAIFIPVTAVISAVPVNTCFLLLEAPRGLHWVDSQSPANSHVCCCSLHVQLLLIFQAVTFVIRTPTKYYLRWSITVDEMGWCMGEITGLDWINLKLDMD
jgi:hypothetical protein